MLNDQRVTSIASTSRRTNLHEDHDDQDDDESPFIRDIHALTPQRASRAGPRSEYWETSSYRSASLSVASSSSTTDGAGDFATMSTEFSALVLAGYNTGTEQNSGSNNLSRIREEENLHDEANPLAIELDGNTVQSPVDGRGGDGIVLSTTTITGNSNVSDVSVQRVKKDEVETKITAWQNAKIAKISNRFKREDAVINGWEGDQVDKASSRLKKVERKLEEKRLKAQEKMQDAIAKAHRKAEVRRASAEAKRGSKVAKVFEMANLMRAIGRAPVKRSFF